MKEAQLTSTRKAKGRHGNIRYLTNEAQWPEYVRLLSKSAAEAGRDAIRRLHAAGVPAVFARDGKIIKSYPDGHEEVLSGAGGR